MNKMLISFALVCSIAGISSIFGQEIVIQSFKHEPVPVSRSFANYSCWESEVAMLQLGFGTHGNFEYPALRFVDTLGDTTLEIAWNMGSVDQFQFRSVRYTFSSKVNWIGKTGLMIDVMPKRDADSLLFRFTLSELTDSTLDTLTSRADEEFWWFQNNLTIPGGHWITIMMPFDRFFHSYGGCTPANVGELSLNKIIGWEINTVKEAITTENPNPKIPVSILLKNLRIY